MNREWMRVSAARAYAREPERFRAKMNETRSGSRADVLRILGGHCEWCGCDDYRVLELDHRNGGGQQEFKHGLDRRRVIRDLLNGTRPLTDFRVLCAPCNRLEYVLRRFPELQARLKVVWT